MPPFERASSPSRGRSYESGRADRSPRGGQTRRTRTHHTTEKHKTPDEERPVVEAIVLKYRVLELQRKMARTEPKEAQEMFDEDLLALNRIAAVLADFPHDPTEIAALRALEQRYPPR